MSEQETKKLKILKVYESFNGSYWYFLEYLFEQEDEFSKHDKIYFGYAVLAGLEEFAELGNIAEAELLAQGSKVWEVPKLNWTVCKHYDKVMSIIENEA